MDNKKRKFLKAGAILAIISSVFAIITGAGALVIKKYITEDNVVSILKTVNEFVYAEDGDSYTITYKDDDGIERTLTQKELVFYIDVAQKRLSEYGAKALSLGIATLVVSIILLAKASQNKSNKGLIIALLILAFLGGNMLTFAFMIVALCLKDYVPTLENIQEISNGVDNNNEY